MVTLWSCWSRLGQSRARRPTVGSTMPEIVGVAGAEDAASMADTDAVSAMPVGAKAVIVIVAVGMTLAAELKMRLLLLIVSHVVEDHVAHE